MKKIILFVSRLAFWPGCASPAQRMAECQAQRINKDACYQAEQNPPGVHHERRREAGLGERQQGGQII